MQKWILWPSVGAVAFLAGVIVWGVLSGENDGWYSAWGQWVGGVGSIAAAATALWIAQRDWKRADAERRRREAEERDRETAQARSIIVEVRALSDSGQEIVVTNYSDNVITDLLVHGADGPEDWQLSVGALTDHPHPVGVLGPGADSAISAMEHRSVDKPIFLQRMILVDQYRPKITFTDAAGLRWRRVGNDQPIRILNDA
ncbi:hypothetical protein REH65_33225 (plasmid) [Saccharopolyspora sp. ID03-671]|uniref:hypothetical protein n=1 Tax=Saccharopolyspora sp. ID03-671 TaxID=3073066 RepID=UPI00325535AA